MTRKKAIEIVVANVKMGWPIEGWQGARADNHGLVFIIAQPVCVVPVRCNQGWWLSREWLEENGHLK